MNIYYIERNVVDEKELEYYIAIGKSIFGNVYYVLDCNYLESFVEIKLIYCNGLIEYEIYADDFCEFKEHYYEQLGHCVFSSIEDILERTQEDELPLSFSELPEISKRIVSCFPWDLREILKNKNCSMFEVKNS